MSSTFAFFADAGLTAPMTRADFVRGSTAVAVDKIVYFGSPATGKKLQNVNDPGVDALEVSAVDAASGSGVEVANIKLALTAGGLASATGGAPLSIGTTLLSGSANAVAVYVRLTSAITTAGNYDDTSLQVADWVEADA